MKIDTKMSEDLNTALDALLAMQVWLDSEQAISRSSCKGDSTRAAVAAHSVFLEALAKAKPLIEKRRLSKIG
jgi:hypothetical protein